MGEGTNGVTVRQTPPDPDKLEQRVAMIREHLGDVVKELDHRRHELTDVKLQLEKHAPLVAGIGAGVVALIGAGIGYSVYQSKKREKLKVKLEREQQYESILHKVISTAAGALVGVAVKALANRFMKPAIEAGRQPLPALPDY